METLLGCFSSQSISHTYRIESIYVPATVVGTGVYGKLFYLCNMLFGGKLALLTRNFRFNMHLKILNAHNCALPGTLPTVNLHIVPIVPKM